MFSQYHFLSAAVSRVYHYDGLEVSTGLVTSLALPPWQRRLLFLVALVSLSVCLSVCGQHYSNSYERIGMKFYGWVLSSTRKN